MSKHSKGRRFLKYPLHVYKHWALNNWNYFTKPRLKKQINQAIETLKGLLR